MTTRDDELIAEIEDLSEQIKRLCANQSVHDIPRDGPRSDLMVRLQAELDYARQCVCQDKLAKWEERRLRG